MFTVSKEVSDKRYSICKQCEHFARLTKQCKKCKCFMKVKTTISYARCPVGKWYKEQPEKNGEGE